MVGASPHAIEAMVNAVDPVRKVRRCPSRSATLPAGINNAANTIVYAFNTQESVDADADPNVSEMLGKATKRIVVSRKVAKVASDAMASVSRLRRSEATSSSVG